MVNANSTPSVASKFHFQNVDDLGGIISPVRDEVFGNYSVVSHDGTALSTTTQGMSDTVGSYTDGESLVRSPADGLQPVDLCPFELNRLSQSL